MHPRSPVTAELANAESAPASNPRATRKVLVLAYRFPPQGGGGVQRTLKFVKYLPAEGWLPVVHTVANPYWPLQDASLLSEIPPIVQVSRSRTFEFERFARSADGLISSEATAPARKAVAAPTPAAASPRRAGLHRRLLKSLASFVQRHLLVPDPQITWVPGAFFRSLSVL